MQVLFRLVEPGDTTKTVLRKKCLLGLNAAAMLGGSVTSFTSSVPSAQYLHIFSCVFAAIFLAHIFVTRRVSLTMVSWCLGGYTLILLALDWIYAAYLGPRMWPCLVLVLDVNLVTDGSTWLPLGVLGAAMLWFFMSLLEESFRIGIYDFASVFGEGEVTVCDCDTPPCFTGGLPAALSNLMAPVCVLCADFYFKRRFSKSMFASNKSMEASIAITQSTARALADFDLETASLHMDSSTDLPDALREAFVQLLTNLTSYKPYLPEAILNSRSSCQDTPVREAPGLRNGVAAIAFTDIKSSTATWEAEPTAMKQALRIHNTVLRNLIQQFNGYEVKTIGDSFMVAFESFDSAVGFGLASQVSLYEQDWPAELMMLPQCARLAGAWNGLRIRVGVHYGEVEVEKNAVNDRFDYFGTTVNKAARLEGVCTPGGVAVDRTAADAVVVVDDTISVDKGPVDLHGLGVTSVRVFYPCSLSRRSKNCTITTLKRKSTTYSSRTSISACSATPLEVVPPARSQYKQMAISTTGAGALHDYEEEGGVHGAVSRSNESLAWIQLCLDRSDGNMVTVVGSSAFFSWNVTQPCASHAENACRFASLMQQDNDGLVTGLCCST
ncbi:Adenylate cyclase [Diplonema papillatum]|nr:Adenylate cyclase [Diplonema papillatum]